MISDDRIDDGAVKALIAKKAQERDVVNHSGLKEAAAFQGIPLLSFLYFCEGQFTGRRIRMDNLKRFTNEDTIGEHNRHPREVRGDIKADREVRGTIRDSKYILR